MKLQDTRTPDFSIELMNMNFDNKAVDTTSISCDEGVEIKHMDVLCGRGKNSFNHIGNKEFRDIVAVAIPGYVAAVSRSNKSEIVTNIVRLVRENGGRFLKRDGKRGVWYVLNYTQSKEKAGHAIRDATITEDSKKERANKRKKQRGQRTSTINTAQRISSPSRVVSSMLDEDTTDCNDSNSSCCETSSLSCTASMSGSDSEEDYEKAMGPLFNDNNNATEQQQDQFPKASAFDDPSSFGSLSNILMAHFPIGDLNVPPMDSTSSADDSSFFEPLSIDDPFNSYIDQLLGPLTDL